MRRLVVFWAAETSCLGPRFTQVKRQLLAYLADAVDVAQRGQPVHVGGEKRIDAFEVAGLRGFGERREKRSSDFQIVGHLASR
jgi:hypothetical protein